MTWWWTRLSEPRSHDRKAPTRSLGSHAMVSRSSSIIRRRESPGSWRGTVVVLRSALIVNVTLTVYCGCTECARAELSRVGFRRSPPCDAEDPMGKKAKAPATKPAKAAAAKPAGAKPAATAKPATGRATAASAETASRQTKRPTKSGARPAQRIAKPASAAVAASEGEAVSAVAARLKNKAYLPELARLQIELVKLQEWIRHEGLRVVVVFEGRDAAGKGGVIKTITQSLNPRVCRVVALTAPTEREKTQWYFQRYVAHLPAAGGMVLS